MAGGEGRLARVEAKALLDAQDKSDAAFEKEKQAYFLEKNAKHASDCEYLKDKADAANERYSATHTGKDFEEYVKRTAQYNSAL